MQHPDDEAVDPHRDRIDPVSWRRLGPRLWVGHSGTHGLGTIELSRGFVFVDARGTPSRGYPTLVEAQEAATGAIDLPDPPPPVIGKAARIISTTLLAGAAAIVAMLVWMLSTGVLQF